MTKEALEIVNYLKKFQVEEGIKDPLEDKVLPHTYTTSFFGLLSALMYSKYGKEEWGERAEKALEAELKIINEEKSKKLPSLNFHWEFKNYALINCYMLLRDNIPRNLKEKIENYMLAWRDLNDGSTNWRCMRALNYYLRYKRFGKLTDLIRSKLELKIVLRRQTKEGLFPDTVESYSFQYHAYVLALLYQYYKLAKDKSVKKAFLKGIDFILDFIDPAGDFNYFGRGQEQIFGYGSLIFALEGAAKITEDGRYKQAANCVFSYLKNFEDGRGIFPLVLNKDQEDKAGWYEYNTLGDYLSFLGVYSFYSSQESIGIKPTELTKRYTKFYPELGFFIARREKYFLAISTGTKSEIGGLIHVYPKIIPCPGGPSEKYELNFVGPYYMGNPIKNKVGAIGYAKNIAKLLFNLEDFILEYFFCLNKGVRLKIKIFPKKKIAIKPLHVSSFKKLKTCPDTMRVKEILTPDGKADIYESDLIELDSEFECDMEIVGDSDKRNEEDILLYSPKRKKNSRGFLELLWVVLFDYLQRRTRQV